MHNLLKLCPFLPIFVLLAGCESRPTKLSWNDPAVAAAEAIETYDRNADAHLSSDELKESKALADNLRRLDTNRDGKLSADELRARIEELHKWVKYLALEATVMTRSRPAVGAELTLKPEPFLGDDFPTYTGTVSADGICPLKSDGRYLPGVPVGFYTLTIVNAGKETIRGIEIAEDTTGSRLEIAL